MASEGATSRGGGGGLAGGGWRSRRRRPAAAPLLMSPVNASTRIVDGEFSSSSSSATGDQEETMKEGYSGAAPGDKEEEETMKEGYGGAAPGDEEKEEEEEEEEEEGPVVFLCVRCGAPLGDSLSWAGSDEENHIHLTRVTDNVLVSTEQRIYKPSHGRRCLVVDLSCRGCQSVLGMVYQSTPKALDYKRQVFCFQVAQLESYVLGSGGQQVAAVSPSEKPLTLESRANVEQQLLEMKTLVVSMAQRLNKLENGLVVEEEP
ncbi:hypothetical protein CRUP_024563 [Coryphaenoides rupestris]|nr:hypothetical protein CRUP_024563 [Coryphaenoides rupestris]